MNNVCPECGGVLSDDRCQFCGAVIIDMACIDLNKPFYLKFKKGNKIYRSKCVMETMEHVLSDNVGTLYYDDTPFKYFHYTPPKINMTLRIMPVNGIEYVLIDTDIVSKDAVRDAYEMQKEEEE